MNILFLLQDTGRLYGAEQATLDLATRLQQEPGCNPSFLLIGETRLNQPTHDLQQQLEERGIPFHTHAVAHPFSFSLIRAIRRHLKAQGPSILHCTGYKANLHGLLAAASTDIPLVSTVHGWLNRPDPKERFYAWIDLQCLKRFDRVIALSSYYRDFLLQHDIPTQRLRLVHSPLPPGRNNLGRDAVPSVLSLGTLGRLSTEKNQHLLLQAFQLLRERDPATAARICLLIAGDGPEKDALQQFIHEHKLADAVTLAGFMPRDEFFRAIDVFILCSRIENFPLSILEAIAAHKPCIATRVGGIPDQLDDQSALLVPSDDPEALAGALAQAVHHPERLATLAHRALEKAQRDFSEQAWIQAHLQLYRELETTA